MQRINILRKISSLALRQRGFYNVEQKRYLATVKEVFPHKTDFPNRHIGPRKTDVVAMLDVLGFKVHSIFINVFLSIKIDELLIEFRYSHWMNYLIKPYRNISNFVVILNLMNRLVSF